MNVEQIEMPVADAKAAFLHYRDAVRGTRTGTKSAWRKQDIALMRGYRALAKGKRLLDLQAVMHRVGLKEDFHPKLAICYADAERCFLMMDEDGSAAFSAKRWSKRAIRFPADTFQRYRLGWRTDPTRDRNWASQCETLVPMIPPQHRPPHDLSGYHILWEVDEWKPAPSRDPMLLKHLDGSLYVVLATWDLTPLEMSVLR